LRKPLPFKLPKPSVPQLTLEIDDDVFATLELRFGSMADIFERTGVMPTDGTTWSKLNSDSNATCVCLEIMNERHEKHDAQWFADKLHPSQYQAVLVALFSMWSQAQPDMSQLPEELRSDRPVGEGKKDDPLPETEASFTGALAMES
jgi:hypothetical protein